MEPPSQLVVQQTSPAFSLWLRDAEQTVQLEEGCVVGFQQSMWNSFSALLEQSITNPEAAPERIATQLLAVYDKHATVLSHLAENNNIMMFWILCQQFRIRFGDFPSSEELASFNAFIKQVMAGG